MGGVGSVRGVGGGGVDGGGVEGIEVVEGGVGIGSDGDDGISDG